LSTAGRSATLRDDGIVIIRGRDDPAARRTLTCDPASDQLTAASGQGTFTLGRVR
jgi:hypothetical protein